MQRKNKWRGYGSRKPVNQDTGYHEYKEITEYGEDEDDPDPNYECTKCQSTCHIVSEVQQHTYNFCQDCDAVTRHRRL